MNEELRKETRKAYLAGMLDGEGSIHCSRNQKSYYLVHLALGMNQDTVPRMLQEDFGGSVYLSHDGKQWSWQLGAAPKVRVCLETLLPYLRIKRKHAITGLAILRTIGLQGKHIASKRDFVLRERLGEVLMHLNKPLHPGKEVVDAEAGVM